MTPSMILRQLAAIAAAALLLGALAPVPAASAADATLTGIVSGASGPEAGIVVGWVEADDFARHETVATGASGEYSLAIPDDVGPYFLFTNATIGDLGIAQAIDPDFTSEFFGAAGDRDFLSSRVTPYPTPVTGTLDITLTPSGEISGTAEAYAGLRLFLQTLGDTEAASIRVPDDGSFSFDALYPGEYRVTAVKPGLAYYSSPVITVAPGTDTELVVTPQAAATISGVVKNGSQPLKGITVEAFSSLNPGLVLQTSTTSSTGAYSVPDLQPGDYRLVFRSHPTSASKSFIAETVSVPDVEAAENRRVNEKLASAGSITGRFSKISRGGTAYVRVYNSSSGRLAASTALDSASTRFAVGGMAAGRYTVLFTNSVGKRYDKASVTVKTHKTVDVGARSLSKKTVTLSGVVTGARGGYVTASLGGGEVGRATIRSTGKYRVLGLVPGTYTVSTGVSATEKRSIILKVTSPRTKTLTPGTPMGRYTGTLYNLGVPVWCFGSYRTRNSTYSRFECTDGSLDGFGRSGPATLAQFVLGTESVPERSPYWYTMPAAARSFTLTSGATKDLGTFELELMGIPDDLP